MELSVLCADRGWFVSKVITLVRGRRGGGKGREGKGVVRKGRGGEEEERGGEREG